jgi:hypothetical protein
LDVTWHQVRGSREKEKSHAQGRFACASHFSLYNATTWATLPAGLLVSLTLEVYFGAWGFGTLARFPIAPEVWPSRQRKIGSPTGQSQQKAEIPGTTSAVRFAVVPGISAFACLANSSPKMS